jgi:hypothetical protein
MRNRSTYPLNQSPLYKMVSRSKLAALLGVSGADLRLVSVGDALYSEFDIPKKSGNGVRHVENPCKPLKRVQARLAKVLSRINPPEFLFCPVKRRCYVTNAAAHRGNRVVQCLDIRKFFPSTPQRRVFWFFHSVMHCERDIAGLLANLACYQGHLPTGSPLSPIMAYFSYYDLWARIAVFCKERGYTFTVYIDDVTISGERVPKADLWQVQKMIHGMGLRYHKEKTFVDQPAEITGVVLRGDKLVAPFRQHKKMYEARALLAEATEDTRQALIERVAGISGQIQQIAKGN